MSEWSKVPHPIISKPPSEHSPKPLPSAFHPHNQFSSKIQFNTVQSSRYPPKNYIHILPAPVQATHLTTLCYWNFGNTNKLYNLRYLASTCLALLPSSRSLHQDLITTYSSNIIHNKYTFVLMFIVQVFVTWVYLGVSCLNPLILLHHITVLNNFSLVFL